MSATFVAYLQAKRTVDDRALDPTVRARLLHELEGRDGPLEVLEIGAGIGTMIERLESWGVLRDARYTALDAAALSLETMLATLRARGFDERGPGVVERRTDEGLVSVRAVTDDFFHFADVAGETYDLVVAHAVLDLFDLDTVLPLLRRLTRPASLLYLTVTYDGETRFEPPLELDAQIEMLYNRSMDTRRVDGRLSGDSLSGRHLVDKLGMEVLASGRSDWVVRAEGAVYPASEASFVAFILDTMAEALTGHPELDAPAFEEWLAARRRQLSEGTLGFRARHVDVLARVD